MSTRTTRTPAVSDVTVPRSYDQWCPIAVGLDLLGDRWTLLIVRELMLGDQRFTDLRRSLTGLAPNLLTERLRTLVDIGLVTTAELPPPAARTVYRLTDEGRSTAPVLRALARFGARHLVGEPGPAMHAARAASALMIPWYRPVAKPLRARLVVTSASRPKRSSVDLVLGEHVDLVRTASDTGTAGVGATERVDRVVDRVVDRSVERVDVELVTTVEALAEARRAATPLGDAPSGAARRVAAFRQAFAI
jgi:DNA-binding HxlR family transcriptional regulator